MTHTRVLDAAENRKRKVISLIDDQNTDSDKEEEPRGLSAHGSNPAGPPIYRGGKWTSEEEVYSLHLIQLFCAGTLLDCKEGTTLRAYLSEKLDCKPMRITKKFSTDVYDGKLLYIGSDAIDPDPAHLISIRDSYLQPKRKRSHKKKVRAGERGASTSITASVGPSWLLKGTTFAAAAAASAVARPDSIGTASALQTNVSEGGRNLLTRPMPGINYSLLAGRNTDATGFIPVSASLILQVQQLRRQETAHEQQLERLKAARRLLPCGVPPHG
jgi:hypothetical protein